MAFYRLVKRSHFHQVQREDVEADTPRAAIAKWNDSTADIAPQFDDGFIDAIEMVEVK